jgi:hypothetical protein
MNILCYIHNSYEAAELIPADSILQKDLISTFFVIKADVLSEATIPFGSTIIGAYPFDLDFADVATPIE